MKKLILSLLTLPLCAFAQDKPAAPEKADKYQVTGPVVELTDTKIVVTKANERFEFNRAADTKVEGDLKVGAKNRWWPPSNHCANIRHQRDLVPPNCL